MSDNAADSDEASDTDEGLAPANEQRRREALAKKIEAAQLDTLPKGTPDGIKDPGDIIEGVLAEEIDPEQVDDLVIDWVNSQVDIPFIGEAAEEKLLWTVASVVKSAVTSAIRTM